MADNKINVGGRLHSIATGNVLAGANEVFDDDKGKKQSDVNAETDAALEDRYTKEQTYSKSELNNMITTPNQEYVSVTATAQTTAVTDVLPATGEADTVYRVGNWDGSQFDASGVYSEYAWNGSQYVHLSTKTKIGEVFDISAYHATGGTLAKYADLTAALDGGNNIPQSLRKGGMSIKFVRSDNKYVRYNLLADSFTTDTTQWAVNDIGVYVESLEFAYIKTDALDRIIIAVKKDGSIFFGNGVPPQIVNYIQQKIEELSLDEYEDIVTFLGSLIENDKTLQQLLDEKVDKEVGKSLIDSNVANSKSSIISSEFFELKTDLENKIIEGIEKDGTKHVYVDEKVEGSLSVGGKLNINKYIVAHENRDGIETKEDADGRILENTKPNGTKIHYTHNEFKQGVSFKEKVEVYNNIGANTLRESVALNISSINALNPFEYYYPRLVNMGFPKKNTNTKPLVLCHISDVHGQQEQYDRIVEFLKLYNGLYDDVIVTGDIVAEKYGDSISYLDAYNNKALLVIGNHDAWERNALPIVVVSAKDDYDKFIAPFIGNWDVTQPDNASSGKCYYYKDYPQSKIRLIVTDCMHDSQDQTDFVINALEEARQNEYGVIISQHYAAGNFTPSNVAFQSIDIDGNNIEHNDAYVDVVDTFIENGGEFICWLCGHHHVDLFGYLVGHPAQLQVCIDCTRFTSDFDTARLRGTKTQDVMNIYSFDVETGIFSILRVGATLDRHLQKKDSIIVDYRNKSILV